MQKIKYFLAVLVLLLTTNIKAQFTITNGGGCSSGSSNSINVGPGIGSGSSFYPVGNSGACTVQTISGCLLNIYSLFKLVNGTWTAASSPNVSVSSFTGLAPGTYLVTGQFPQFVSAACPGGG